MANYEITLESEWWEPGSFSTSDDNTDVFVTFADGSQWVASFFTYANILSLAQKNRETGECLSGKWFWSTEMFLVDEVSLERIREVVADLIREEQFFLIFKKIAEEKSHDEE